MCSFEVGWSTYYPTKGTEKLGTEIDAFDSKGLLDIFGYCWYRSQVTSESLKQKIDKKRGNSEFSGAGLKPRTLVKLEFHFCQGGPSKLNSTQRCLDANANRGHGLQFQNLIVTGVKGQAKNLGVRF